MKAAVYAGTRNVYQDMIPSMKSLLIHSDVDKIYFLIEDDEFPYELPPEVKCINVSNQQWFPIDGPNMNNRCSYMVLLRAAFTKLFPDLDRILCIDNDIIITENISELWELDLSGKYYAGIPEPRKSNDNFLYINFGFVLYNLDKLREDKKDDEMIYNLNNYYYVESEQTCFNYNCQGYILQLSNIYNSNWYTTDKNNISEYKVRHYAFTPKWQIFPLVEKYRNIEVKRNVPDNYNLDIIIPHYNNFKGLENTLKSVYYPSLSSQITITVIDDCSSEPIPEEIQNRYSLVNFVSSEENQGPGIKRQLGIDITNSSYIMFIDAGDIINPKVNLIDILKTIKQHSSCHIISYSWFNEENKTLWTYDQNLHGKIFKREFLELYNIRFSSDKTLSYNSEDWAFSSQCYIYEDYILHTERLSNIYISKTPLYIRIHDPNSLSNKNPHEKTIRSTCFNYEYATKTCRKNNVSQIIIAKFVTQQILELYFQYLKCAKEAPELLDYNLTYLKQYYKNIYRIYEKVNEKILQENYHAKIKSWQSMTSPAIPSINIYKFIDSLKEE